MKPRYHPCRNVILAVRQLQSKALDVLRVIMFARCECMEHIGQAGLRFAVTAWSIRVPEDKLQIAVQFRTCQRVKVARYQLKGQEVPVRDPGEDFFLRLKR